MQHVCYICCVEVEWMQHKTLKKVNPFPGYVRVSEPDKEELARLTALAKGENRSLREFALACGVSTSTLSRIINMKSDSDTPNSDSLIASIAFFKLPTVYAEYIHPFKRPISGISEQHIVYIEVTTIILVTPVQKTAFVSFLFSFSSSSL